MFSEELSPVAKALVEAGQSVIHITGAVAGMLVSVSCQDQYGSGVVQAWPEVAHSVNRTVHGIVMGFMRDVAEPGLPASELAEVVASYYSIEASRVVMGQLTEWASEAMGVGEVAVAA